MNSDTDDAPERDLIESSSTTNRAPELDEFVVQEMEEVPAALVQYEML